MKYVTLIIFCFLISSCSTEEVKEFIDCVYDGNSEQYKLCLENQLLLLDK